jgi:RNA polymerase sigma factor (sigma-70 family)
VIPEEATPGSFEAFYSRERTGIGRALVVTLRDADLAADALDEALARAYQRWPEVSGYDNAAGWVYRVALNWARSATRRRFRPRRLIRSSGVVSDGTSGAPDVDIDVDLERALHRLSIDHRAVVVCRFYLGCSEAETAAVLGLRPGTVKSRLSRALGELRDSIELTRPSEPQEAR